MPPTAAPTNAASIGGQTLLILPTTTSYAGTLMVQRFCTPIAWGEDTEFLPLRFAFPCGNADVSGWRFRVHSRWGGTPCPPRVPWRPFRPSDLAHRLLKG